MTLTAVVEVPLRGRHARGRAALIDREHPAAAQILDCRWYVSERDYVYTFDWEEHAGVSVRLHQVVMTPPPLARIDHINRDPLDNRLENLRLAPNSANAMNRQHPRGKTGLRGVSLRGQRFHAKVRWQNESLHLGDFDTARDAARVYDLFALLLAGEFALPNAEDGRYTQLIARLRPLLRDTLLDGI